MLKGWTVQKLVVKTLSLCSNTWAVRHPCSGFLPAAVEQAVLILHSRSSALSCLHSHLPLPPSPPHTHSVLWNCNTTGFLSTILSHWFCWRFIQPFKQELCVLCGKFYYTVFFMVFLSNTCPFLSRTSTFHINTKF